ncbi:MAG TPA: hypothetical protein VIF62_26890, partial [Labilithrix sp.]
MLATFVALAFACSSSSSGTGTRGGKFKVSNYGSACTFTTSTQTGAAIVNTCDDSGSFRAD